MKTCREIDILKRIISYCDEIDETTERFGASYAALESDRIYKNALAMCVLQIGELTSHLSDGFKTAHRDMPW